MYIVSKDTGTVVNDMTEKFTRERKKYIYIGAVGICNILINYEKPIVTV